MVARSKTKAQANANGDTNMEQTQNQSEEQKTTQEPGLTVQDLQAIKAIIDVASSRGSFKPNEMVAVGQTYTKLEQFLATITKTDPQE
jgi:hypothetical protein